MKKITDFFRTHRYVFIWTLCYTFVVWAVLRGMFNFNMFSAAHWTRLMHIQFRGFAGFVFGVFLLGAPSIYIATTSIIIRTGKPLIKIGVPQFITKIKSYFAPAPAPVPEKPKPAPEPAQKSSLFPDETRPLPAHIPPELRGAFVIARTHKSPIQTAVFNRIEPIAPNAPAQPEPAPDADLPLPSDFDIADTNTDDNDTMFGDGDIPVFREVNFDDDAKIDISDISELLSDLGHKVIASDNDIIITDKYAIAIHNDSDIWIADDNDWFASGKQKPSPVMAVKSAAEKHNVKPVLYLAEKNIIDLENRRKTWTTDGVIVIDSLQELVASD